MAVALERLDRRAFVDDPRIVEDERGPGLAQREALPFGTVGSEHTRLAALDALAPSGVGRPMPSVVSIRN